MTPERLAEIRARAEAATPGPWAATHRAVDHDATQDECCAGLGLEIEGPPEAWRRGQFARSADAAFIAHARTDIPDLLAEVERLTAENAQLKEQRDRLAAGLHRAQGNRVRGPSRDRAWLYQ